MVVRDKIVRAYKRLIKNDGYLLENDVNERSITHQLAIYIQDEFPEYNVDCEYNRTSKNIEGDNIPKKIDVMNNQVVRNGNDMPTWGDKDAKTVYPDIIVHIRGLDDKNFIVIEAKKTSSKKLKHNTKLQPCYCDECKLKAYKNNQELSYKYAFFILFPTNGENIVYKNEYIKLVKG